VFLQVFKKSAQRYCTLNESSHKKQKIPFENVKTAILDEGIEQRHSNRGTMPILLLSKYSEVPPRPSPFEFQ
jgi:hypothetical protein